MTKILVLYDLNLIKLLKLFLKKKKDRENVLNQKRSEIMQDLEIFFENVSYEAWPISEEIFFDSSLPEAVEVKIGFYDLSIFNKILLVNYG